MSQPAADLDVVAYLASKGKTGHRAKGDEVAYPCFFTCQEPADSRKRKLYINTSTGMFHCKVCLVEGGTYLLQQEFGDDPKVKALPGADPYTRRLLLRKAQEVGAEMLRNNDEILMYLCTSEQTRFGWGRGLSAETVLEAGLGYVGGGWSLVETMGDNFHQADLKASGLVYRDGTWAGRDFFTEHLLIPYLSRGGPTMIRGRALDPHAKAKYLNGPDQDHMLYCADDLDDAEDAVITEGEFDRLILKQTLMGSPEERVRNFGIVGIAGTGAIPPHIESYFPPSIKRIYIALDPDDPGRRAAVKLKEKLGTRARIVELPSGEPKCDWTDYIARRGATWRDCMDVIGTASGKRVFSVREAGTAWRSRRELSAGIKTGFKELDNLIMPGLLPGQVSVVLAKTGVGKGHPLDEEIVTPDGWKKWGDLQVGDLVYGSSGATTKVTGVFDRGVLPTYRVTFRDNTSVLVDGDHLWQVYERYGKRREWTLRVLTTQELLDAGLRKGREYRWKIPMASACEYPKQELPIEPYTLGSLIANGGLTNTSATITTPDVDVIERIRQTYECSWRERENGVCAHGTVLGVIGLVRQLGLTVKSSEKFIPSIYLHGDVEQRIALLQGLMDADGSARDVGRGNVLYHTSSRRLAKDVQQLIWSLGGTAMESWFDRGEKGMEGRLGIMLPDDIEPFSTSAKRRGMPTGRTEPRRVIVSIEPVEDREIRCISVAAADQLYVVGRAHIVTHNTLLLCNWAFQMRQHKILFISLEMTREEVYDRLRKIYLFHNPHHNDETLEHALRNIMICDENKLTNQDFATLIDEFVVETGCRPEVVFVDYLGYFARSQRGNGNYEKVTNAIMQLKAESKGGDNQDPSKRFHIVTPAQVNRVAKEGKPITLDDARDSGAIEETADFLVAIYKPDDALMVDTGQQPSGRIRLDVLKSRHGGKGRSLTLVMDNLTLAIVEASSSAANQASEHNRMEWQGFTWDDLRREQTKPQQRMLSLAQ